MVLTSKNMLGVKMCAVRRAPCAVRRAPIIVPELAGSSDFPVGAVPWPDTG